MGLFGVGFRILLVALAVLQERLGALLRRKPVLRSLREPERGTGP